MTELRNLNRIVVVGGGTAGWMTALYAKKILPNSEVTLIESEDIGILGAGEGTTPNFVSFTDTLDIPVSQLIQEADATIKNGIKFTNWNGDGKHYYHGFDAISDLSFGAFQNPYVLPRTSLVTAINEIRNSPLDSINFVAKLSEADKVPHIWNTELDEDQELDNPMMKFTQLSYYGVHFNAAKVARALRKIGESRGIVRVEGVVVDQTIDESGDITNLRLENGSDVGVDFLFDCSGFARKFIGKIYEAEWQSHQDKLTVKRAIPFFVEHDKKGLPAYTEAVAMKYGWVWSIPTQERFGSGYVFDSDLISDDEAKKELDDLMGYEVESPRTFNFDAGYYKTPWVGNCIATGLASGFIEPLEATSLWTTAQTISQALGTPELLKSRDPRVIDEFNKKFRDMHDQVVDFVYFHYMSKRSDTEFWKQFSDISRAPEFVQNMMETWEYRLPEYKDYANKMFLLDSWISVAAGLGHLNKDMYQQASDAVGLPSLSLGAYEELERRQKEAILLCLTHDDLLSQLKDTK